MRILNTKPDKYLVESLELDLYDILYKAILNQWNSDQTLDAVSDLLVKYHASGFIGSRWDIRVSYPIKTIEVTVFSPKKIKIRVVTP